MSKNDSRIVFEMWASDVKSFTEEQALAAMRSTPNKDVLEFIDDLCQSGKLAPMGVGRDEHGNAVKHYQWHPLAKSSFDERREK